MRVVFTSIHNLNQFIRLFVKLKFEGNIIQCTYVTALVYTHNHVHYKVQKYNNKKYLLSLNLLV
jgi:hypothetical protein